MELGSLLRLCLRFQWRGYVEGGVAPVPTGQKLQALHQARSLQLPQTVISHMKQVWSEPSTLSFIRREGKNYRWSFGTGLH